MTPSSKHTTAELHQAQTALGYQQQLRFATALNDIAAVIAANDTPDAILENANRRIAETLHVDRALLYDVSFEKNCIVGLCEWLRQPHPDIAATKDEYPLAMFLSPFTEIRKTKQHLTSQIDAVTEHFLADGSGKILHGHFKIKSLLWYPFAFDDHGYYVFTLNQILTQRPWTAAELGFMEAAATQVTGVLIKIRLLAERTRAEAALRTSEEQFRLLFNSSRDAILVHELTPEKLPGRFIEVNQEACRRYGYTRAELLQMRPTDLDAPEGLAAMPAAMQRLLADGHAAWEGMHLTRSGRTINVDIVNVLYDFRGQPMIMAVVRDITARTQAEAQMTQQLDELRRWQAVTLGREGRINELKREVNALAARLGEPPRYATQERQ